jgi:glucokinase
MPCQCHNCNHPFAPLILGGDLGGQAPAGAGRGDRRRLAHRRRATLREPRPADFATLLADFLDGRRDVRPPASGWPPDRRRQRPLDLCHGPLDAAGLARRFGIGQVRWSRFRRRGARVAGLSDAPGAAAAGRPAEAAAPRLVVAPHRAGRCRPAPRPTAGGSSRARRAHGFRAAGRDAGALWHHLNAQHGRVTAEDVVSGDRLARFSPFLHGRPRDPEEIGAAALAGDADALPLAACGRRPAAPLPAIIALHWLARAASGWRAASPPS